MPTRFAILHHTGIPQPHYDLLFETFPGSDLATWRSPTWPIETTAALVRLKDHRRVYLDFEGELSRHRGHVERIATGTCELEIGSDDAWRITLLSGVTPAVLHICRVADSDWEARNTA